MKYLALLFLLGCGDVVGKGVTEKIPGLYEWDCCSCLVDNKCPDAEMDTYTCTETLLDGENIGTNSDNYDRCYHACKDSCEFPDGDVDKP